MTTDHITPAEFAALIGARTGKTPRAQTVRLWLRRELIPGAYFVGEGAHGVWKIPRAAADTFTPPAWGWPKGRKRKSDA